MSPSEPNGFSDDQRRALALVLDTLIPPSADGRLPGAGALGVVEHVDRAFDGSPEARPLITAGLAAVAEAAADHPGGFEAMSLPERQALLEGLAAAHPGFVPSLVFHTYVGYYQAPRVLEALGLEPRPPYPKGYELEPGDLSRLDNVRRRGARYRPIDR